MPWIDGFWILNVFKSSFPNTFGWIVAPPCRLVSGVFLPFLVVLGNLLLFGGCSFLQWHPANLRKTQGPGRFYGCQTSCLQVEHTCLGYGSKPQAPWIFRSSLSKGVPKVAKPIDFQNSSPRRLLGLRQQRPPLHWHRPWQRFGWVWVSCFFFKSRCVFWGVGCFDSCFLYFSSRARYLELFKFSSSTILRLLDCLAPKCLWFRGQKWVCYVNCMVVNVYTFSAVKLLKHDLEVSFALNDSSKALAAGWPKHQVKTINLALKPSSRS